MKKSAKNIFLFLFSFFSVIEIFSQNPGDPKSSAELLSNLNEWCSANAAYSTKETESEQPFTKCNSNPLRFAKWFKFQATRSSIEIKVKIGNSEGSMLFPYISLRDESLNELTCLKHINEQEDIVLYYSELTPGRTYYFSVNNHNNSKYAGTFTLCVSDEESNNFIGGAVNLWNLDDWCSEKAEFTTLAATPDGKTPSCIPKGPNFNTWFKFQAGNPAIELSVKSGGSFGTCKFPILTLWDETMAELACNNKKGEISDASVQYRGLTKGKTYYLSVDHIYNDKYQGSFTLCAREEKSPVAKTNSASQTPAYITGKLYKKTGPVSSVKMKLLDEKGENLGTAVSDSKGKFRFQNLSPQKIYIVKMDSEDNGVDAEIFLVNEKGEILKKTTRDKKNFRFEDLPPDCNYISIIDCSHPEVKIAEGKIGILGKMISKKDPVDAVEKQRVYLMNSPQKILDSAFTDQSGKFQFINYPSNQNYLLRLGDPQEENYTEIVMINDKGKAFMSASSKTMDGKGFFRFEKLPPVAPDPIQLKSAMDERIDLSALPEESEIEENKIIMLNHIYFESGEYKLLDFSFDELNRLAGMMSEKKSIKIEVSGHTDKSGNETANLHLSENRAKAVVDYLISKGINEKRLSYLGMGSSSPISPSDTEENKKKNRRVEFKVVK